MGDGARKSRRGARGAGGAGEWNDTSGGGGGRLSGGAEGADMGTRATTMGGDAERSRRMHYFVGRPTKNVTRQVKNCPFGEASRKGRFSREPRYGRRIALDPREKVSQNSFSFLISQKAVAPMSYEWRRSRDLSNGCGPPTMEPDAKPCGANVRSSVSIAQTRHSASGQFRKFKLTHYPSADNHPRRRLDARLGPRIKSGRA